MKIAKIEDLHCDAGWRDFSFLKITTDDGIVGWSEYNESFGSAGLTAVIRRMAAGLIGENPRAMRSPISFSRVDSAFASDDASRSGPRAAAASVRARSTAAHVRSAVSPTSAASSGDHPRGLP